ncbi:MAG: hypothetical protein P8I80_08065, partial [Bacteroidales bacterium]|nr:hypothetical protein [Bacteroidales bacterium]
MNKSYNLIEVKSRKEKSEFLQLPVKLYKDDKNWIRPLDEDVEKVFDAKKNRLFKRGDAIRWILYNSNNSIIGRIAAFYDDKTAMKYDQPTGGCGFFECINDN